MPSSSARSSRWPIAFETLSAKRSGAGENKTMPVRAVGNDDGTARVEFRLPPEAASTEAWVAGEFNGWSTDATPMVRQPDGSLLAEVELTPGRSYRFRYYLGDGRWENDWAADAYVDNEHGGSDSVIVVPAAGEASGAGA
jgi:1,4-alpha-glucan branching enzyme